MQISQMKVTISSSWGLLTTDNQVIEPELFRLLLEISQSNSLKKAAQNTGISYRHAWGLIKKWEASFNTPLVNLQRGRGQRTHLTEFGAAFYSEYENNEKGLKQIFDAREDKINKNLTAYLNKPSKPRFLISASNDLVVSLLDELLFDEYAIKAEYRTRGSIESLKMLSNGLCNVAGFHFPLEKINTSIRPMYLKWLKNDKHDLIFLSFRNQGLMVSNQNIKKIKNLGDLTRRSIRYINRQGQSGTRIIFDELLKQSGIKSEQINGYLNEEFTHVAVAAMIASGAADAGMGLEAAARKFNLHFIPLIREAYLLAFNKTDNQLKYTALEVINSRNFRNKIKQLPGYDFRYSGREISVDDLLADKIDML